LPGFGVRVAAVLMLAVQHNALVGRCISYTKCKDSPEGVPGVTAGRFENGWNNIYGI